jgi:hypothetical protein
MMTPCGWRRNAAAACSICLSSKTGVRGIEFRFICLEAMTAKPFTC